MIEYYCNHNGRNVVASWSGYVVSVVVGWLRDPQDMSDEMVSRVLEDACDEAFDELQWIIASSRPEYDGQGERE